MKRQTVTFDNGELTARIEVTEATVLNGAKRTRLRFEANGETDPDRRLVRLFVYPDLLAASVSIEIGGAAGDPEFDRFLQLPEALIAEWEAAVVALNPHWYPAEQEEKKDSN